jgi:hypothetical protein
MWLADLWVQVKGVDYKCRPGGREELRDLSLLDSVALNKRHIIDHICKLVFNLCAECTTLTE